MKIILLVEDEKNLSDVINDELTEAGYKVLVANTGKECYKHLETVTPDLVILDIKLPDVCGLQLLKDVRRKFTNLPILICTAFDSFQINYKVWASKISEYMIKPVDLDDLKAKVKINLA